MSDTPALQLARKSRPSPIAIVAVVILAGILRFYALDSVPPGINQDEAIHAYEAWCIQETGHDHYDKPWPIFFRCFGDYHAGHYIYTLLPCQALFGMTVWSTRLPAALFGTLNIWFLYLLVRRLYGHRAGIASALLLAVSPWHIHLSRIAFEAALCGPFLTFALLLVVDATRRRSDKKAPAVSPVDIAKLSVAGLIVGTVLYMYNPYRVVIPILMFGGAIMFRTELKAFTSLRRGRAAFVVFLVSFHVAMLPFIWASVSAPDETWARAAMLVGQDDQNSLAATISRYAQTYFAHFHPSFLFFEGDPSPIQSVPGYGQLHHFCLILLPIGLWRVIRRRRSERFGLFVLLWIVASPIPAAATPLVSGHSIRAIAVLPAYQILAALGLDFLLAVALAHSKTVYRGALALGAVVIALNTSFFLHLFLGAYPRDTAIQFQQEWREAAAYAKGVESDYDAIVFTTSRTNQVPVLYLFWKQVPPKDYFGQPRDIQHGERWDTIHRIGNTFFAPSRKLPQIAVKLPPNSRLLVAERPGISVPGTILGEICYPNGAVALVLYDVRTRGAVEAVEIVETDETVEATE